MSKIFKASLSKIDIYNQCPKKYYYKYVSDIKVPFVSWDHFELGNLVHKTLQYFHTDWIHITQDKYGLMGQSFERARATLKVSDKIAANAKPLLTSYLWKIQQPTNTVKDGTEWFFKVHLKDNIYLTGVVDRIDKNNNQYHVADYKTGKTDTDGKQQLKIYAYAISRSMGMMDYPINASLISLKLDKQYDYQFYPEELQEIPEYFINCVDIIQSDQIFEAKPGKLCYYCDFKNICDDYLKYNNCR